MSNFKPPESNGSEDTSPQRSDEKMDTGSESFQSTQNTPNSVLSSDFDDRDPLPPVEPHSEAPTDVLRLQNPTENTTEDSVGSDVLRLNNPVEKMDNDLYVNGDRFGSYRNPNSEVDAKDSETKLKDVYSDSPAQCNGVLNDSLMNKMSLLKIDSPEVLSEETKVSRPINLGISPPRITSALTLTSDHPLMGLSSPDGTENYPDIVPEKPRRLKPDEEVKDLSLSSVEDDKFATGGNFVDFCQSGPQRNTSKNNLYFSDNHSTSDNQPHGLSTTPDVARVQNGSYPPSVFVDSGARRKIIPCFKEIEHLIEKKLDNTPQRVLGRPVDYSTPNEAREQTINNYVEERNRRLDNNTLAVEPPNINTSQPLDIPHSEQHSGPVEWASSPSRLRMLGNMQLPVEVFTHPAHFEECDSPDALSTSTEHSAYRAAYEPSSGNVALKHTPVHRDTSGRRRIIAVMDTEDNNSLDSGSDCSLHSEVADAPPDVAAGREREREGAPPAEGAAETLRAADDDDSDDDSHRYTGSSEAECSPAEERARSEERAWRRIPLPGGGHLRCDMKVIEPYKRVLSHGGYTEPGRAHIIVFSACHLPDSSRTDYSYVMDNLFLYVVWTLDRMVTDEYELVYLHGSAARHRLPNFHWLKKSYQLIDRRLRKSLKHLYLVHPTFWLKSIVFMSKPFISSKFSRKITYVHSLAELAERVNVAPAAIPEQVRRYELTRQR